MPWSVMIRKTVHIMEEARVRITLKQNIGICMHHTAPSTASYNCIDPQEGQN